MSKSIAIFGAGPALGRAVARRYAEEGYEIVLVARRPEPLEQAVAELAGEGHTVNVATADLSDSDGAAALADRVRERIGHPDVLYYGPSSGGFAAAADLTPQQIQAHMPIAVWTLVALVREFLPHMIEQRDGAILSAAGASAVQGMRAFSGPGPALAAQRNYLQSLRAEVADHGVFVGGLYIGATIGGSAWHAMLQAKETAGSPRRARGPVVDPAHLADLLWTMHQTRTQPEIIYPEGIFEAR